MGHQRQNGSHRIGAHSHTHTNSKDHASKLNVHAGKRWKLSRHEFQFAIFEEESSQGCDIWTCSLKDVVYVQGIRQRRVIVLVSIRGLFHKISLLAKMQFEIRHVDRSSKMWRRMTFEIRHVDRSSKMWRRMTFEIRHVDRSSKMWTVIYRD